jgi:leucine dehydrogenase
MLSSLLEKALYNAEISMHPVVIEKKVQKKQLGSPLRRAATISLQMEPLSIKGYEEVIKVTDPKAGLSAIIAIHNRTLGPALGGIRIQPYPTFEAALQDVLRLSKGMTYKSSIAEVGYGGGKSVIIADPKKHKTPELLQAFGAAVDQLEGGYICAEDVGCTTEDVSEVRKATQYVVGLPHARSSGDPGPFTAWGTFRGIQATVKRLFGTDSLEGRKIAIQGLGNVGMNLAEFLFWAGAELIFSDIDSVKLQKMASKYAAKAVSADEIIKVDCDILAPCALGGIINDHNLPAFRCKGIAGSANNQLLTDAHARMLRSRGILYAPDFVINAGGLLNVAAELEERGYNPVHSRAKVHRIYDTLLAIYEIAERNGESTHESALALAEYRLQYQIGKRTSTPKFHHF